MNVVLRLANNKTVLELPSLTNDLEQNLITTVKLDVLTHQEVDNNFINIIKYLRTVSDVLLEHIDTLKNLNSENIDKIINAVEILKTIENTIIELNNNQEQLNSKVEKYNNNIINQLNRKIENIKTVNGVNLIGIGNEQINISREQFTNHLCDINANEIGSIILCNSKVSIIFNNLYDGSNLWNESDEKFEGSWKCIGKLEDKIGLFKRVV